MRLRFAALLLALAPMSCAGDQDLSLSFGTFASSPVALTHLGIDQPMATIGQPQLVAGDADRSLPRTAGGAQVGWPGRRGSRVWRVEAQWIEVPTGRAYRAALDVETERIEEEVHVPHLQLIFGPHGLLLAGSDKLTEESRIIPNTLSKACGTRVTRADANVKQRDDLFPDIEFVLRGTPAFSAQTDCPDPGR